jgi:hypothetical protein
MSDELVAELLHFRKGRPQRVQIPPSWMKANYCQCGHMKKYGVHVDGVCTVRDCEGRCPPK